jgi:MOSC domain-containing protein YiiM
MSHASVLSIQVSLPREIGTEGAANPMDQKWFSGFYKQPVTGPVHAGKTLLSGDGQADLRVHGGPDRPILAYCAEHYPRWEQELGLSGMPFGGFGENLTISGMDERSVCLGDQYSIGDTLVEVSQPRQPCWKLARRWRNKELPAFVIAHNRGGWYFRVLHEGMLDAGMKVELRERPMPKWTIARAIDIMYHGKDDLEASRELAECPYLSTDWREYFQKRLENAAD